MNELAVATVVYTVAAQVMLRLPAGAFPREEVHQEVHTALMRRSSKYVQNVVEALVDLREFEDEAVAALEARLREACDS